VETGSAVIAARAALRRVSAARRVRSLEARPEGLAVRRMRDTASRSAAGRRWHQEQK
jgi:hypothetical protein